MFFSGITTLISSKEDSSSDINSLTTYLSVEKSFEINPIPGLKAMLSVETPFLLISNPAPFPKNENKFKLSAGAKTDPPPSVPIPKSFIPLKTFIAVPEDDPVIAL